MEGGQDLLSKLVGHIDGRRCLQSALLLLNPDDLKTCRLVSSTMNEFIVDELWGTKGGREKLRQKLVERWRKGEARMEMIGKAKDELESIFCGNQFVFCGHENGLGNRNDISIHSLSYGNWIKDLELTQTPTEDDHWSDSTKVVGSKDLLAAVLWERIVFFWEVKDGEMVQLEPLDLGNLRCWKSGIQVCGTKAAVLAQGSFGPNFGLASLIVVEKCTSGLVKKTLAKLNLYDGGFLALNGNFIALAQDPFSEELADTRISLWRGDNRLPDVVLPGRMGQSVTSIILEAPFVILSLFADSESRRDATIKVYSVSLSNRMEEISSQGFLLKSIHLTGATGEPIAYESRLIFNDFIIGHVQQPVGGEDISVHVMDKKLLLNPKVPAKDVWVRLINLPRDCSTVSINNTSLVCARDARTWDNYGGVHWTPGDPKKGELFMISFWP